jgi:hypothetical protein
MMAQSWAHQGFLEKIAQKVLSTRLSLSWHRAADAGQGKTFE